MAGNTGMPNDMLMSSAETCVLGQLSIVDIDNEAGTLDWSLSQQLDVEINKLRDMVKCLESMERELDPRRHNKQTIPGDEQTTGDIDAQASNVMDKSQRSGIPIPRRRQRATPPRLLSPPRGVPPDTPGSPPGDDLPDYSPVGSPPKTYALWPVVFEGEAGDHGDNEGKEKDESKEQAPEDDQMEDAESYAESVSVKSAANMYGGQAIIRRIPTPSSQRRQARNPVPSDSNKSRQHHTSNTAENTAEEMLDTGEDDDDDVLVSPLKINRMEDVEKYDNVADDDQVPTYEQFISGEVDTDDEIEEIKINKPLSTTVKQLAKQYAKMDYTVLGTISPLNDNGGEKGDNSKEEMSFVLGRPASPMVTDTRLKRCLSPPYEAQSTAIPIAEVSPLKKMAAGFRSRHLPPIHPNSREPKLKEITNNVGILCEGCNNCLLDLKRQALRLMYPDNVQAGEPITVMGDCVFCDTPLKDFPTVKLREKGSESINTASIERQSDIRVIPGQEVHVNCRRDFIHKRNSIGSPDFNNNDSTTKCSTRSSGVFDFKHKCIFCTHDAKSNHRKRSYDVYPVRILPFQKSIEQVCSERNDQWAHDVSGRIASIIDLPAAEALYHQTCSVNFRTKRQLPQEFAAGCGPCKRQAKSPGRPEATDTTEAFKNVVSYVEENEGCVLTMSELIQLMEDTCGDRAYSYRHMKNRLIDHFGDSISINALGNTEAKVRMKHKASEMIDLFTNDTEGLSESEKRKHVISAAAKMIKADINSIQTETSKKFYPSFSTVSSTQENTEFIPESLQTLLTVLISGNDTSVKLASLGQAIVQACRPKGLLAPLQIGLGVQLHHHFGSRYLVDLLNSMGFSSSYYEVQRFELNAAATLNTTIPSFFPGKFLQFVADNADHNVRTLDGHGTFHGMGIIACTTPGSNVSLPIPRGNIQLSELSDIGKISIKYFKQPDNGVPEKVHFLDLGLEDNDSTTKDFEHGQFDLFSKIIWPLKPTRPSWSGFMQMFNKQETTYPGKSSVTFLPMIDMSPSDMSCINSTLHFVCEQSSRYGVAPVLTFDQPLFQKATQIVTMSDMASPLKRIILRLGGFHTEMSFLGSVGFIMSGSGLQDVLQTIYTQNAVAHMLSGKAVARALRGHFLVDTALHAILLSKIYPTMELSDNQDEDRSSVDEDNIPDDGISMCDSFQGDNKTAHDTECSITVVHNEDDQVDAEHSGQRKNEDSLPTGEAQPGCTNNIESQADVIADLSETYDQLENNSISKHEVCQNENLRAVSQRINELKEKLKRHRTAALWFQYMDMIAILQQFIRAERTGDWIGHLNAIRKMLPYFAASGHYQYLKSAYVYLQNMMRLKHEHPDVHREFIQGNHTVRRTDKYWGGLSTDLIIEQVLMRSLKTTGGLTRGRGMSEAQRTMWLLSMSACAEMNNAMQDFSDTNYATSVQHQEASLSRRNRDSNDVNQVVRFLQARSPFEEADTALRNIETGVTADERVNVDMASDIGENIIHNMAGQPVDEYVHRRKDQAVPLSDNTSIKINDETVSIDPQLLFQRLITVADRCDEDISTIFKYELSTSPSSLFDNTGLPRSAQKSQLADAIWKLGDCGADPEMQAKSVSYVVDGGSLLQKIPWQKDSTFRTICEQYYQYLSQKYSNITVVFDGYSNGPSTKDITHVRRSMGVVGTPVRFTNDTPFRSTKESFLKNIENKQNFIYLLGTYLEERGIHVRYADSDADVLIVETAVELAETTATYVIGEDTDLLVLLCYHATGSGKIFLRSDTKQTKAKPKRVWDIHKAQSAITRPVCDLLPFLHALTGCDTTSRIYGIGKTSALKVLCRSPQLQEVSINFMRSESKQEVVRNGELALILLLEDNTDQSIDVIRFKKFTAKVMTSTACVQVHSLPPTSAATAFHSLRVYIQSQTWIGNTNLQPEEWGWQLKNGMYSPIKTSLPVAPAKLLNVIRCNCKANCDSKRCSCRKHGLECSFGCGACRGISCTNSHMSELVE